MHTLTIILDTNEFIYGLTDTKKACITLLTKLPDFNVKIPRIILNELHNNLPRELLKELYKLLKDANVEIIDKKTPVSLVKRYEEQLPYEDAVIASYCEHLNIDILISENRHFLVDFNPDAFQVLPATEFLKKFHIYFQ